MQTRKCIYKCQRDLPVFRFPKDETLCQKWVDFVYGDHPPSKYVKYVCARHFSEDSFLNKSLFDQGLISKLSLKPNAVPTIKIENVQDPPPPPTTCKILPVQRTLPSYTTRTVATQLSVGTLRSQHFRSRGVQTTVIPEKTNVGVRPAKRPRVEFEEEEEEDSHESTNEQGNTVTGGSDLAEMRSAPEFEDVKYIVFESALQELFENCPVCKKHCRVNKRRCGTFVAFDQDCPHCSFSRKWQSQPVVGETPQGNLELSAAVYFNGASYADIERICDTMNLKVHHYDTFRKHAGKLLEPTIYHKWKLDQGKVFEEMKDKDKIAIAGDMRADYSGQCAKFGSYTIMECENKKILDIQLVQSEEVGDRAHMKKEGLKRALDLLKSKSIQLDYIVTDRHPQVQKYLREREIPHYYDVWHMIKAVSKKLEALANKKGCEVVNKWLPGIKHHMFWTACSSTTGPEKVAKWRSLINHIQNVHEHKDPLFPKCLHPIRATKDPNKWFKPGSMATCRVEKMLLNKKIMQDVHRLSSNHQTSSLESYHNLVLRFAPKNVNYPFTGMLCRLYLAAMHHNENAKREQTVAKGKHQWELFFSTHGRAKARPMKTDATFEYRRKLMHLLFNEVLEDPKKFQKELQKAQDPPSLSPAHDKPSTEEDVSAAGISSGVTQSLQTGTERV